MKERILQFIEKKGISKRKFYMETGLSNGILDKKSGLSVDTVEKIYSTFPEISLEWLITGKGEMLKESLEQYVSENTEYRAVMRKLKFAEGVSLVDEGAPFYPMPVSAGNDKQLFDETEKPTGFISIPGVLCKAYFPVIGFSFEPLIRAGDVIGIDFIDSWERLDPDSVYFIITHDNRMIKRLADDPNDPEKLICISPNFREFPIWKEEIKAIHKVIFCGKLI
ncbi:hypothetical protein CGC54_10155 [Capnocytophaga canimorsus]|uniref:Peptidase S24/S26A/S26B/S26C domain-containing protein n=1 Tax=Capnocytophaga canimorsus TaxID=28188 RepID=A0AAC9Z6P1_9FLAO|nr:helix-turn-helix transcriptional regulator [Capnocytophaga canimorsus]ATA94667.1 hypothetical protein CGC54_10155 [Capnocytophaga canimorsus]